MNLRTLAASLVLLAPLAAPPALGIARQADRRPVLDVPPQVQEAERVGRADPGQPMQRIRLVLPSKDAAARERFLAAVQTPGAPEYHRFLTPAQFQARFGAEPADVAAAERWLLEQGFTVEPGEPGRTTVLFSGTVAQVEAAFRTRMGLYAKRGRPELANDLPATMPALLAGRVLGLASLNGLTRREPLHHVAPLGNDSAGGHYLAPADFATIYGTNPLLAAGIDGRGTRIAIAGRTNVYLSDTQRFRQTTGLPANDPEVVLNGEDPGIVLDNTSSDPRVEVEEANLDIQWAGAAAPNAHVMLVVSKSSDTTDGIDLSIQYAVEHDLADVISVSFGYCEQGLTSREMAFYENLWAQAAAQGIAVFVASGDTGAAGCYGLPGLNQYWAVPGVNALGSSPYATTVGGTLFADQPSSTYWTTSMTPGTLQSAKSYIPETVWNENRYGSGGGVSGYYPQPLWQAANAGGRAVPDVSLAAAVHTPYLIFENNRSIGMGGTSASSPAMAGIAALLRQKAGARTGSLNPLFYRLGTAQYSGGGPAVFHDVTTGNNGAYGVTGYNAGPGFDLATGWGSPDAAALAEAYAAAATAPADFDFFADVVPGALAIPQGKSDTASLRLFATGGGDAVATVTAAGMPSGVTVAFAATQMSSASVGFSSAGVPMEVLLTVSSSAANGTYPIDFTATVGSRSRTVRLYLTVSGSGASIPPAPGTEVQVPVVLDVVGQLDSHYTSDLVAMNRSSADATVQLRFSGSGATAPLVALSLPAGRQLYLPDVVAFLVSHGVSFPGTKLGTLYVTFAGVSDASQVYAGSRISTPNPDKAVGGAFGTFAAAVTSGTANASAAWVYGLKTGSAFRSNLAVVHAPGAGASLAGMAPVGVAVQVYDGSTGAARGSEVTKTLQPGEFWQINDVLVAAGVSSGYARVRRTSGTDRFITYGVVNDGGGATGGTSDGGAGTNDGSLIVSGGSDGLVPIALDLPGGTHYQTEISLTNPNPTAVNVELVYTSSTLFGGAAFSQTAHVGLAAGQQLQQVNALSWLRSLGMSIPTTGAQGGTLKVTGAVAMARTWNPSPSGTGTYGVAYPALDAAHRATTSAWVYGLRQDADVRSNLAIADARVGDSSTRDYVVEVYDADSGATAPATSFTRTLAGGQWYQASAILAGTGVTHGYVRVRVASGSSDFIAYGVVNDGPDAGSRTSDGSYVPMVVN